MDIIRDYYEKAGFPMVMVDKKAASFEKHPDIAKEFAHWIHTREYTEGNCISVENYTAQKIAKLSELMDGEGAFSLLVQLRENPHKALRRIKEGFAMR